MTIQNEITCIRAFWSTYVFAVIKRDGLRYGFERNQTQSNAGSVQLPAIFDPAAYHGKGDGRYPSEVVAIS